MLSAEEKLERLIAMRDRNLRKCSRCGGLGNYRHMVDTSPGYLHGRCYINAHGMRALLQLPKTAVLGLTAGDIGEGAMREIMAKHFPALR